jgi:hypothetical protein
MYFITNGNFLGIIFKEWPLLKKCFGLWTMNFNPSEFERLSVDLLSREGYPV